MRKTVLYCATAGLLAFLLTGCSKPAETTDATKSVVGLPEEDAPKIKPLAERQAAPSFDLKDANGKSVKLEDFKGRVVLMNFWATWCGPCKAEIPWFQEFDKKYSDRGFSMLGVSMDEDGWKVVNPYVEEHKISYRMVLGNEQLSNIYGGIDALPASFIIDGDGKIASIHHGLVSKETYRKEIEDLLEAKHGEIHAPRGAGELAFVRTRGVRAE
jgi:cytochrome c biogenesis protein CcmG/thiol:disulfide interchange protein DsbE